MPTGVWALRWEDVDPARHPFDPLRVAEIARTALPSERITAPGHGEQRRAAEDRVDRALLAEFGPWIAGWRWAASEPGSGGPVRTYCCAEDSLKGSPEEMTACVVAAASDWRARLEDLGREFSALRADGAGRPVDETVCRAAARLLPLVLEWTGVEDAWYATFERFLAWYVEPILPSADRAIAVVKRAIGGRFGSWLAPDEETVTAVIDDLGAAVATELRGESSTVDCLAEWIRVRGETRWASERLVSPEAVRRDGHRQFIETVDQAREPQRAARMLAALAAAREAAQAGEPLSFDRLRAWQCIVLGEETDFRRAPAMAHGGAERYGLQSDTRTSFERCLVEATDASLPSVTRAARLYLDVCYFHPFPDGNARAARLALDYVLTTDGLGLHAAGPIFLVARRVMDAYGVYSLQYIVDYLAGPAAWSDAP